MASRVTCALVEELALTEEPLGAEATLAHRLFGLKKVRVFTSLRSDWWECLVSLELQCFFWKSNFEIIFCLC
jgi:hypothetical protein